MKSNKLTILRLVAVAFIFLCTCAAWFALGAGIMIRTNSSDGSLGEAVSDAWGRPITQLHPCAWYASPTGERGRKVISPEMSDVTVQLDYDPKQKGLLWYRTYNVQFDAIYRIGNPTPIPQTIYVEFQLPENAGTFTDVSFALAGNETVNAPEKGMLAQAVVIPANGSVPLKVAYKARGMDQWMYQFGDAGRIRSFQLTMKTNFHGIDFPPGTGSPTKRTPVAGAWQLEWSYPDVIGAQSIGMAMPSVLNAGPVAARISFFAPVSLLFFFAVLLIFGAVRDVNLHPMNYFFLAAGFFAFQLLFAYLVDVLPVYVSFLIASLVSLVLVSGYVHALAGRTLSFISIPAQFAYMVLFSYSFFFDGLSGLTITIGAVATLAILMITTAKIDWAEKFACKAKAAPIPVPAQ